MEQIKRSYQVQLWTKYFFVLFLTQVFIGMCMQFYNTTTPLFVGFLGGSTSYSGLLVTSFTISATVLRILSGRALDRRGRREIIIVGLLIFAVSSLSFCVDRLWFLPLARLLQGAGYSIASTGLSVAIADVLPRQRMSEGIGYFGLSFSLASVVGPAVALTLCSEENYHLVFYAAAAMLIACALLLLVLCRYETDAVFQEKKRRWAESEPEAQTPEMQGAAGTFAAQYRGLWVFFEKTAVKPSLVSLFINLPSAATISFLMLFAKDAGIENAGLYFTISAIALVAARLLFSRAADRFAPLVSIGPGILIGAVGYAMILLSARAAMLFFVAGGLLGLSGGLSGPTLNAIVIKRAPENRRGAASATYLMSSDVGIGIGSFFWGLMIERFSYTAVFVGCTISMLIALALALLWLRK